MAFHMNLILPMLDLIMSIMGVISLWITIAKATSIYTCLGCESIDTTCSKKDIWRLSRKIVEMPWIKTLRTIDNIYNLMASMILGGW